MARYLVLATAGAGGDLQPLVAAALALRERGHELVFLGDESVARLVGPLGIDAQMLPRETALGPRLANLLRTATEAAGGDPSAAGPLVEQGLAAWADEVANLVSVALAETRPDAAITSLFGVEVLKESAPPCSWAVINSTFYVGPNPPRSLEQDVAPRARPLLRNYARLLQAADLVLHATDPVFDFSFQGLPPNHHYVGPLGIWEPPSPPPGYLDEPGDPWVLVSISSQLQDDVPLAETALRALEGSPVRVLVTLGPDHAADEISTRPPNAYIEQTAPHSAVLQRGRLLVSHAGHGSVMKALWYGRPMVLIPWGRDQPGVAARARALGVAEVISRDELSASELATTIDRALNSGAMTEQAAAQSARLQTIDPPTVAASLLESLLWNADHAAPEPRAQEDQRGL